MIFQNENSLLLSTGLNLDRISDILTSDKSLESALREEGEKYLERYKVWKRYKELTSEGELSEPVLPLFTSLPCIGKTSMSREVATAFGLGDVMGGDAFRSVLREFVEEEKEPAFFLSIYETWKLFGEKTEENMIKGYKAQAKIANNAMEKLIVDRGIRDGESMVFEYLHFLPSHFHQSTLEYPSFIPIVLSIKDDEAWKERIMSRTSDSHLKGGDKRLLNAFDVYSFYQDILEKEARERDIPIVYTDDYAEAVDQVISIIIDRVKKLNSLAGEEIEKPKMQIKYERERKERKESVRERV